MDLVKKDTGEIFEVLKDPVPFRSITDLKDFKDDEKYIKGSSQVDLTGYEPLESIIARCTRTMVAPGGQTYQVIDADAIKAEAQDVPVSVDYEAGNASSIDEAFETEDPTTDGDFDLVDASSILSKIGATSDDASERMALHVANEDAVHSEQVQAELDKSDEDTDEKKATA